MDPRKTSTNLDKSNKKIHDIWNINVDAQYHEEKKDSDYAAIKSIREVPRSIKN